MNRQTISQHTDALSILRGLIDLLDRHKEVIAAEKEARKELELTDKQIEEVNEWRALKAEIETSKAELDKKIVTLENISVKTNNEIADLDLQRTSLIESIESVKQSAASNERNALKNEETKKQNELKALELQKQKEALDVFKEKLDEREKALDVRAEKILLREKAADL